MLTTMALVVLLAEQMIHLREGTVLRGQIVSQAEGRCVVETSLGTLDLKTSDIVRIEFDPPAPAPTSPNPPARISGDAGAADELFFLRSNDGNFALMPSGRLEYDAYAPEGGSKQVPPAFAPRRVRLEAFGNLLHRYDFQLGAEYAGNAPVVSDAYVSVEIAHGRMLNLQLGQFDAPFSMENRTSDKFIDLQERALVVRTFAFPENKQNGAMLWGQPPSKWAWFGVGAFNGEGLGQGLAHNERNFAFIGRAWVAPAALAGEGPLRRVALGASVFKARPRSTLSTQLPLPASKTVAGFTFFNPIDAANDDQIGLYDEVTRYGVELNAPIGPVVVKAEAFHVDEKTRETAISSQAFLRDGRVVGDGQYVRASWFVWGDPLINGLGGMELPPRLGDLHENATGTALQLVVEEDHLRFRYLQGAPLPPTHTDYGVDVFTAGVNVWQTKHVHWTGNVSWYDFLGAAKSPLLTTRHTFEATARITLAL